MIHNTSSSYVQNNIAQVCVITAIFGSRTLCILIYWLFIDSFGFGQAPSHLQPNPLACILDNMMSREQVIWLYACGCVTGGITRWTAIPWYTYSWSLMGNVRNCMCGIHWQYVSHSTASIGASWLPRWFWDKPVVESGISAQGHITQLCESVDWPCRLQWKWTYRTLHAVLDRRPMILFRPVGSWSNP